MEILGPDGKLVEAEELQVVRSDDPWLIYELEDGTVLRIKLVLSQVFKVKDVWTPDGDPVYVARSQNVVAAVVPPKLKRATK